LDPVALILLDGFYLKTHIANTRKLLFSFYSIEMTKEKKWISSHRLQNSEQIRTINYNFYFLFFLNCSSERLLNRYSPPPLPLFLMA